MIYCKTDNFTENLRYVHDLFSEDLLRSFLEISEVISLTKTSKSYSEKILMTKIMIDKIFSYIKSVLVKIVIQISTKKESKMKMQLLFVALERLDGQRPSQREKGPHRLL